MEEITHSIISNENDATGSQNSGLKPNVQAVLAYLFAPITGFVILSMTKDNRFVKFHAIQSIIFGLAAMILSIVFSSIEIVLIGFILSPLYSLGVFIYWLLLMWKAYNNEEYEIPFLGKIARDQLK